MVLVYIFFVLCIFFFARSRGRSGLIWAFISLIISPLLAWLLLLALKNLRGAMMAPIQVVVTNNNVVNK